MKVHEVEQGSVDWMLLRSGIPTASEFDRLLTPEFKIRTGQMPASYLAEKIAEGWQGGPLASFNTFDMDMGNILEDEAVPTYNLLHTPRMQRVGFITTDDGRIGCSPDGLLGDDGGIEIKCPRVETHTRYLLDGTLPKDYAAQVHGSMFVTGRPYWRFMSYRRHFPTLLLSIDRDEKIQAAIGEALGLFLEAFDKAMKRMVEINGGPKLTRTLTDLSQHKAFKQEEELSEVVP